MGNQNNSTGAYSSRAFDANSTMSNLRSITTRYGSTTRHRGNASTDERHDVIPPPISDMSSYNLRKLGSDKCDNGQQYDLLPLPLNQYAPSTVSSSRNTPSVTPHHRRRRSSLLCVQNGVTGKFISSRICKIAAKFWKANIETLSAAEHLEVGCSIFFGMISNPKTEKVMKANQSTTNSIESTSVKYLDMLGWLIRHLVSDNIDLYALLDKLGVFHQRMGIKIHHFVPMLQSMHDSFAYYFEQKYNIEVKYAMDEIFSFAAQVMTGQELHQSSHLMNITKEFQGDNIPFLKNLSSCLESSIGREYLFRYLSQTWCDEIVIFLKSLYRFKHLVSDRERFVVAREITKHSIDPIATFTLNLSYETRMKALYKMDQLEKNFAVKEEFEVPTNYYDEIEVDIMKLIKDNHWARFVEKMETLKSKSFELQ